MKISEYLRHAQTDIVVSPKSILTNIQGRLAIMNATDIESFSGEKMGDSTSITGIYNDKKFRINIAVKGGEAEIHVDFNGSQVQKSFSSLEVARIPFWVSSVLV